MIPARALCKFSSTQSVDETGVPVSESKAPRPTATAHAAVASCLSERGDEIETREETYGDPNPKT